MEHVLKEIYAFCEHHNIKPSTFARRVWDDHGYLNGILHGRKNLGPHRAAVAVKYMQDHGWATPDLVAPEKKKRGIERDPVMVVDYSRATGDIGLLWRLWHHHKPIMEALGAKPFGDIAHV